MSFGFLKIAALLGVLSGNRPSLVDGLNPPGNEDSETIIGGTVVPHANFPELVYLVNGDHSRCSGAIIGPKVILTAAHCVSSDHKAKNYFTGVDFVEFEVRCDKTPQYASGRENLDFALCKSVKGNFKNAHPATLDRNPVALEEKVMLTGYGCTNSGGSGGNNGILKMGRSLVYQLPDGINNWFYTFNPAGALCYGDSGGPAYRNMNETKDKHMIVGVNSRGNIRDISLLTAVYLSKSEKWIKRWAKVRRVRICGVNLVCKGPSANTTMEIEDELAALAEAEDYKAMVEEEENG